MYRIRRRTVCYLERVRVAVSSKCTDPALLCRHAHSVNISVSGRRRCVNITDNRLCCRANASVRVLVPRRPKTVGVLRTYDAAWKHGRVTVFGRKLAARGRVRRNTITRARVLSSGHDRVKTNKSFAPTSNGPNTVFVLISACRKCLTRERIPERFEHSVRPKSRIFRFSNFKNTRKNRPVQTRVVWRDRFFFGLKQAAQDWFVRRAWQNSHCSTSSERVDMICG